MTAHLRAPVRGPAPLLASGLLMLLLLVGAPGAQAHDALVGAQPSDGAVLTEPPAEISLMYSGEILPMSPVVVVTGAAGGVAVEAAPAVEGRTVVLDLPRTLAADDYQVSWRVVSGDGHPIEGTLGFTVAGSPADGSAAMATTAATAPSATTGEPAAAPARPGTAPEDETDGGSALSELPLWLRISLMLAATASVVGLVVIAARRGRPDR